MIITNKFNLPGMYFRAVQADPYDKGPSDFSATGLANPPRATALLELHGDTVEVDCSRKCAAMLGRGTHKAIEPGARPGLDIVEERFFADFLIDGKNYVISAQIDQYEVDTKTLFDWKTTKAGAFTKKNGGGKKAEWAQQMNVGAEIMRRQPSPIFPEKLVICGFLKDWYDFKVSDPGYPQREIMTSEQTMWPREKVFEYIEKRVRLHVAAKESLPICTENWGGGRCAQWCDASSVCSQYQEAIKTGLMPKEND